MKKLIYILFFLFPFVASSQQSWYKDSPVDYMWKNVGNAGFTSGYTYSISLAFSPLDGQPYVAINDHGFSSKATVMKFDGSNWVNVGVAGFSAGAVNFISLAFSPLDNLPYVAYSDYGDSLKRATVMKFDGTNWLYVGNADFSVSAAYYTSLAFSPSGQPFVAYEDCGNFNKASVMKFDGSNWLIVGNAGFSSGYVDRINIKFSSTDNMPYVAYMDCVNSYGKATVMKFDGMNWVTVGNAGFSSGFIHYPSFAISPIGEPYMAYRDFANSYKTTVMKFDGTNWVNVGNAGFSIKEVQYTSIAFSPSGQPYVAYNDYGVLWRAIVMKFDGTNWTMVGNSGVSAGEADYINLVLNSSGLPYVAFQDAVNSYKATVMKYDSVYVGIKEPNDSKFEIYPNPASNMITIASSAISAKSQLSIMNVNGLQLITRHIIESKTQLDISNLPSGVYFVRLTSGKSVEVGKFIKL